ncbi:MAG TPA: 6-bladed beta-propeller [Gammaproteobacteria bacterium]|nr:6-bladed beta-propeller [Gammaproteobacteria bacterium]
MFHLSRKIINRQHGLFWLGIIILLALTGCGSEEVKRQEVVLAYPPPPDPPRFFFEGTIRSSFDVKEITGADKLKIFATGTLGTATGLGKPYGVAVYHGRIFVTDTVKRAIMMFDVPGKEFKMIGTEGPGTLSKPIGIAISRKNGEIFVADNTAKRVVVFDQEGNFLRAFGNRSILRRPSGIAVSPDGSKAYVVDTGGVTTQEHHMFIFNAITGELEKTVGTRGRRDGDFNLPLQATTAPDGTVYVTDSGNFRVQAFNPDGTHKMSFGTVGRKVGNFARPKGIATDNEGNIYVVDSAFGNFQIFNSKAQLLMFVGQRSQTPGPGRYMLPAGIAVDEDGRVYMVDQFFSKVDIYRPATIKKNEGWLGGEHHRPKT